MNGVVKEEDEDDEDMKMFMTFKNRISDLPDYEDGPGSTVKLSHCSLKVTGSISKIASLIAKVRLHTSTLSQTPQMQELRACTGRTMSRERNSGTLACVEEWLSHMQKRCNGYRRDMSISFKVLFLPVRNPKSENDLLIVG